MLRTRGRAVGRTLLAVVAGAALTGCSAADRPAVAATVNGRDIAVEDVDEMVASLATNADVRAALDTEPQVEARLRGQVLTQLVRSSVMRQEAGELGIEVTDGEVRDYIARSVDVHLGGRWDSYDRFKEDKQMSEADVVDQMRDDLYRDRLAERLAGDVDVTGDRIRDVYAEGWEGHSRVRHILLGSNEEALAARDRLAAGEGFGDLVRELTLDEPSIDEGGDLGPYFPEQFDPAFDKAVREAADGEVVGPVETQFGFHVIERLPPPDFDAVAGDIEAGLLEQERKARVDDWLADRLAEADVDVDVDVGAWDVATAAVVPDVTATPEQAS